MSNHTPTPWKIAAVKRTRKGECDVVSMESEYTNIASVYHSENAEFLVRACNTFDEMLEALHVAEILIAKDIIRDDAGCLKRIRSVIAKAEGEGLSSLKLEGKEE